MKKLDYEFIKERFEKEGYTLLSKEYINNHTKLEYICPNGHKDSICWHNFEYGKRCKCNSKWKGGIYKKNLPLYKTYATQLEKYQTIYKIEQNDLELLGVKCIYCDQIFIPSMQAVRSRLDSINGKRKGESNLYCSSNCKKACPTYEQKIYPKNFKQATSREVQPELRKLVLARDNYICIRCGATLEKQQLHCHHIDPVISNPIESADIDNCITLCYICHKKVHDIIGCTYNELRCS